MKRAQQESFVQEIQMKLKESTSVILVDFSGLPVPKQTMFRKSLSEHGLRYSVVKNTLLLRGFQNAGLPIPSKDWFRYPTGILYSSSDPLTPLKLLRKYQEENDGIPKIKGIVLEQEPVPVSLLDKLLPYDSKKQLLAECIGGIMSPLSLLSGTLFSPLIELVRSLEQIAQKKSEEASSENGSSRISSGD